MLASGAAEASRGRTRYLIPRLDGVGLGILNRTLQGLAVCAIEVGSLALRQGRGYARKDRFEQKRLAASCNSTWPVCLSGAH